MLKNMDCFDSGIPIEDFTKWKINKRSKYGGRSCNKVGLIDPDNNLWMLKLTDNLKIKIIGSDLSYSNSPITEYIGSKIYKELGIPVHEVKLGKYNGKLAVACKDFTNKDADLIELGLYKINNNNGLEELSITSNFNIKLSEQIEYLKRFSPDVTERFWDMFIVDTLLGNGDRTDNNWGFLADDYSIKLAPVYDNGASLNPNSAETRMIRWLDKGLDDVAYRARTSCFLKDKGSQINPFKYIASMENKDCTKALNRLIPKINNLDYKSLINSITLLSSVQREFYIALLDLRIKWFNTLEIKIVNMD